MLFCIFFLTVFFSYGIVIADKEIYSESIRFNNLRKVHKMKYIIFDKETNKTIDSGTIKNVASAVDFFEFPKAKKIDGTPFTWFSDGGSQVLIVTANKNFIF